MNGEPITPILKHKKDEDRKVTRQLVKGGLTGIAGYTFLKPLNLFTSILIARFLGTEGFGLYNLGLSINVLMNVFTNFGLTQGIVKYSIKNQTEHNIQKVKGVIFSSLLFSLLLCFATLAVQIFYADEVSQLFFQNDSLSSVLIIFALSVPFNTLYALPASFAQSFKKIKYLSLVLNIIRPVSFLLLILVVIALNYDLNFVLYANLLSTIITAAFSFYLIKNYFPEFFIPKIKAIFELKPLISFSYKTMFTGFLSILMIKIDRLMIGYFTSSSDVGIYSAAANLAINVTFFLTPFAMIFSPISVELFHKNNFAELNKAFKNVTRWLLIFTMPIFFIFSGYAPELLMLFGKDYSIGAVVLILISFAELINVSTGPVGILLKMSGHQGKDMAISVLVLVINSLLNFIMIPIYGMIGAAIATGIAIIVTHSLRLYLVWKLLKIFPYDLSILRTLFSFIIIFAMFYFFAVYLSPSLNVKIGVGVLCMIIYVSIFMISKKDEDDVFILNSFKNRFLNKKKSSKIKTRK